MSDLEGYFVPISFYPNPSYITMAIKIVPREVSVEFRKFLLQFALLAAIVLFAAFVLAGYAVVAWVQFNPGITILFGLIAFALIFLAIAILMKPIAQHEIDLRHSPQEMQFFRDKEAVEAGLMSIDDFLKKHGVEALNIAQILQNRIKKDLPITLPDQLQAKQS